MEIGFQPVLLSDIQAMIRDHLATLTSPIDSYLEDHILQAKHYQVLIQGGVAGFASINGSNLITQFHLSDGFKALGQAVFARLKQLEQINAAFVPTCDEFFLAHALDDFQHIHKHAYFFMTSSSIPNPIVSESYALRPAHPDDEVFILQESGDFFESVARRIAANELFVMARDGHPVGFGVLIKSALGLPQASIGMYTIERFRGSGIGKATIASLVAECRRQGLEAVAGCAYDNHLSKQLLERAGMFTQTRLLKIDF